MSCRGAREWRAVLAHRFDEQAAEPAAAAEALAHLADCERCRALALEIDPSLVFLGLRSDLHEVRDARDAGRTAEIDDMRAAVAGLRRAAALREKLEPQLAPPPPLESARPRGAGKDRRVWLGRLAAAAVLAAALGALVPAVRRTPVATTAAVAPPTLPAPVPVGGAALASLQAGPAAGGGGLVVSGDVGRPSARVYEIGYTDMAVVMVVDKSLDL